MSRECSTLSPFGFAHILLQQSSIVRPLLRHDSRNAHHRKRFDSQRILHQQSSTVVKHPQWAVATLLKRVASAAGASPVGPSEGVLFATLGDVAACFALFFGGGTGCPAKHRGERLNSGCSSLRSTNLVDSGPDLACFARFALCCAQLH